MATRVACHSWYGFHWCLCCRLAHESRNKITLILVIHHNISLEISMFPSTLLCFQYPGPRYFGSLFTDCSTSQSGESVNRSMGWCNKDITPLLTHWSYVFLALTHRDDIPLKSRFSGHQNISTLYFHIHAWRQNVKTCMWFWCGFWQLIHLFLYVFDDEEIRYEMPRLCILLGLCHV